MRATQFFLAFFRKKMGHPDRAEKRDRVKTVSGCASVCVLCVSAPPRDAFLLDRRDRTTAMTPGIAAGLFR